jgi:hypothetical protein
MGRKGTIELLDPRLKKEVDAALSEGRATLDQIVQLVRGMGGEVSRSAVHRYSQGFEESLKRYREAQQVAGQWIAQFQANPDSDVGRLLAEMCKTLAFQTMASANEGEKPIDMLELSRLARAVKALTDTDRVKAEMQASMAARVKGALDQAVAGAEAEAKDGRIPAAALKRIREEVYGVVG